MSKTLLSVVTGNTPQSRGELVDHVLRTLPDSVVLSVSLHGEEEGYPVVQRFLTGTGHHLSETTVRGATGAPAVIVRQDLLSLARASRHPHLVLTLSDEVDTLPFLAELWRKSLSDSALDDHYTPGPVLTGIEPTVLLADVGCVHSAVRKWSGWDRGRPITRAEAAARQVETANALVVTAPHDTRGALTDGVAALLGHLNRTAACLVLPSAPAAEAVSGLPSALFEPGVRCGPDDWLTRLDAVGVPHTPSGTGGGVTSVLWRARRPVHPERLADTLGAVLPGVVRGHGHLWLSSRPASVITWRSAGAHLELREAGHWLEDTTAHAAWRAVSPQRRTLASWYWDPYYGERRNEITFTGIDLDTSHLNETLDATLLSDEELSWGPEGWGAVHDPLFSADPQ